MLLSTEDLYLLWSGEAANYKRYFWKIYNEPELSYESRFQKAAYTNYLEKVINIYLAYVFYGKAEIKGADDKINPAELAREICTHMLVGGKCHIVVLTNQIFVCRADSISKEGRISIKMGRVRVEIDTYSGQATVYEGESPGVTEKFDPTKQLICAYWNELKKSLLADIAMIQIQIFNDQSLLDQQKANSNFWFMQGSEGEGEPEAFSFWRIPQGGTGVTIVTVPNEEKIKIARDELESKKMDIAQITGLQAEFLDQSPQISGVSKAFSMIDISGIIKNVAGATSTFTNESLKVYSELNNLQEPISINLDPFLTPEQDIEILDRYIKLAEFLENSPIAVKEIQKIATAKLLGTVLRHEIMESIRDEIDKSEGRLRNPLERDLNMSYGEMNNGI